MLNSHLLLWGVPKHGMCGLNYGQLNFNYCLQAREKYFNVLVYQYYKL